MTIKVDLDNPLLKKLDTSKVKTKLQKEIDAQKLAQMTKEEKERENKLRLKEASE